jgi:hypothetical protein
MAGRHEGLFALYDKKEPRQSRGSARPTLRYPGTRYAPADPSILKAMPS